MEFKPWVDGPLELLQHGFEHMKKDSDFDYRISMISIDNSIELMLKTYLELPKRITNINGISRQKRNEISNSFPALLDALEQYAPKKIIGFELGDIEWFHRIRNQLYHDGNGITVERKKVEIYYEIAAILCSNLFEVDLDYFFDELPESKTREFFIVWSNLISIIKDLYSLHISKEVNKPISILIGKLYMGGIVPSDIYEDFKIMLRSRNSIAHGEEVKYSEIHKYIDKLKGLITKLNNFR